MHKGWIKAILSQGGYDSLTNTYVNGMATKPSTAHIKLIDLFIRQTKSILQNKADVMYLGNINDSNDSFRNVVKNAHHGTKQGSGLVWDPYWGYSNPAGTGWVDTNYNPATQGVKYTLNNAGVSAYFTRANEKISSVIMISCGIGGTPITYLKQYIGGQVEFGINQNVSGTVSPVLPFTAGLQTIRRTATSVETLINQNITNVGETKSSAGLPNANFRLFDYGSNKSPYTGGINFTYIGDSLTDAEFVTLNDAVNDYLIQCLFLKYGEDNWGVKMAKSYFLNLHNFAKYEAWEVYEFIKRHQSDYTYAPLELSVNSGAPGLTDWVDTFADGLADNWAAVDGAVCTYSIVTGNGFTGNAQRIIENNAINYAAIYSPNYSTLRVGTTYVITGKYRSSVPFRINKASGPSYIAVSSNTGNAISFSMEFTATETSYYLVAFGVDGCWLEIDEISIKEKQGIGYYYNTFGPNGLNKSICDYLMLFKAGGNLLASVWTKTGALLRWNQDGQITSSNTMPAYTRGTGLGLVSVTSTDGFTLVSQIIMNQTNSSVNSFYGNFPMLEKINASGSHYLTIYQNRIKLSLLNTYNLLSRLYAYSIGYPGYIKYDLNKAISSTINGIQTHSNLDTCNYIGSLTSISNQITTSIDIRGNSTLRQDSLNGTLANLVIANTLTSIRLNYIGITGGTVTWNKLVTTFNVANCLWTSTAITDHLQILKTYFQANTPTNNLACDYSGTSMGIVASNHQLILDIAAIFTAAGKTFTCTTRTS